MNSLDIIIVLLLVLLASIGYAQGFIVGAASLIGLALGGVVGTRVSQAVLEQSASDATVEAWSPLLGLGAGMLITIIGAMAMQDIGAEIKGRMRTGEAGVVDHLLGAVLLAGVGVMLVWFGASAAMGMPQLRDQRIRIVESTIVGALNDALPPAGPIIGAISSYDPFPAFDGGTISIAAPDGALPKDPEVLRALRSVVRVEGEACGYRVTGSGWVIANGYVVTNAHVVAGEERTEVEVRGSDPINANVVVFDEVNDLALLRVSGLNRPALPMSATPTPGTAGVVIGYPEQRGLTSTAARFSDERRVRGANIYGKDTVVRLIDSFRGQVRHGNSGGPVVDESGNVITTVFASTVGEKILGGYGVPNSIVKDALATARKVPEGFRVRTGSCIS
ncbi:MAG: MarP family serine protease [Thermoleophilia bacterium]|nr:MarP family serine protease [Thermoleophilia bacterium]